MLATVVQILIPIVAVAGLFWVSDIWAGGSRGDSTR